MRQLQLLNDFDCTVTSTLADNGDLEVLVSKRNNNFKLWYVAIFNLRRGTSTYCGCALETKNLDEELGPLLTGGEDLTGGLWVKKGKKMDSRWDAELSRIRLDG